MERQDQDAYRLGLRLRQAVVVQGHAEVDGEPAAVPAARAAHTRLALALDAWAGGAALGPVGRNLAADLAAVADALAAQSVGGGSASGAAHLESFRLGLEAWLGAKCPPPSRAAALYELGGAVAGIFEDEVEGPAATPPTAASPWVQEPGSPWVWPRRAVHLAGELGAARATLFPHADWGRDPAAVAAWEGLPQVVHRTAWAVLERGLRRLAALPPPARASRCHDRDRTLLAWYEDAAQDTFHRPAAILMKWNALHPARRMSSVGAVRKAIQRVRRAADLAGGPAAGAAAADTRATGRAAAKRRPATDP